MYRFIKKFERDGIKIAPGVVIDRNLVVNEDCVSVAGSNIFNDIPFEYLENFEPVKYKKTRTQSEKKSLSNEKKSDAANARISSMKEALRLCD